MKTHDFWYDLPEELIAQTPLEDWIDNYDVMKMLHIRTMNSFCPIANLIWERENLS